MENFKTMNPKKARRQKSGNIKEDGKYKINFKEYPSLYYVLIDYIFQFKKSFLSFWVVYKMHIQKD